MPLCQAILVAPVDPECRLTEAECEALQNQIEAAEPGDAIVVGVPIQIFHLVEGMWIASEDLPDMLAVDKDAPVKREPMESSYVPPGARHVGDDADD